MSFTSSATLLTLVFVLCFTASNVRAQAQCSSQALDCPGNSVNTPACFNRIRNCIAALLDEINSLEEADVAFDARLDRDEAALAAANCTIQSQ